MTVSTTQTSANSLIVLGDCTYSSTYAVYDRLVAYSYAQEYWDEVCSDCFFVNTRTTFIPLDPGTDVTDMTGYDCAHFVSCCIGNEPNEPGGGLDVPSSAPLIYGELGATQLGDWLVTSGIGVEKTTVSDLMIGDIINYDWNGDGHWDHVAFYLGDGEVAGHTTSVWEADWELIGATDYRFVHILASPWVVDDDGSADFYSIQSAINAASEGDAIFVKNGLYYENVVVNKTVSLNAESYDVAIIGDNKTDSVLLMQADHAYVKGFSIIPGTLPPPPLRINLASCTNCIVENNEIVTNYGGTGIKIDGGSNNSLIRNNIEDCTTYGILIQNSSHNLILQNSMNPHIYSVELIYSDFNRLEGNRFAVHLGTVCILLMLSHNNTITANTLFEELGQPQMDLYESKDNVIYHNNFDGWNCGVNIWDANCTGNCWDDGCEGNYWGNYVTRYPNASSDLYGIWDTLHEVSSADVDRYPLRSLYWNPADVNHDLIVNIFDITLVAACYCIEWQDHMCHVDLVEPYGVVDIFDIVLLADSYGEEYPGPYGGVPSSLLPTSS